MILSKMNEWYPINQNSIQVEDYNNDEPQSYSTDQIVQDLSEKISKIMFPLYDTYQSQSQNGKVMGLYPVLRFPTVQ